MTESFTSYVVRLLIALAIGGAIGLEREFKGKPAGLRTNILVCMGSCLIMIISLEVARAAARVADPGRIAAQVVTGAGFLGAGAIIRSRFHISGLTTAATIWVLSALGLAIGAGYIILSVTGAFLITVILVFIRNIEDAITRRRSTHIIQLGLERKKGIMGSILEVFTNMGIPSEALEVNRTGDRWTATFEYTVSMEKHLKLVETLSDLSGVEGITQI